jgi:hypothetical protein
VNTQGTNQRAPWGDAARAEPAYGTEARAPRLPPCAPHFPQLRERAPGPPPAAPIKYERIDGPADQVTLGDNDAEIFRFSGRPDSIMLSANLFGALFTLTSRLGGEPTVILVGAGETIETFVARDRVLARNAVAGSNSKVTVVGKWATLDEPTSAY